jgi:Protein of unknown function DUF262
MFVKNIQKTVFKISDFLSWQRAKSLLLSPAFQRRPVWPRGAKSLLIDTILRGIPMPIVFIRERTNLKTLEPQREVVDGQQRLRTVISFIQPETLPDFNEQRDAFTIDEAHNPDLAGLTFGQLPPAIRQRILDYDFSVHVLPSDTEDREVLQIFGRMNSTGFKLNDQELRNAEYFGAFKELMYRLAYEQLERWRAWKIFTETDIARMLEVEETSDMVITILIGLHGKKQAVITKYYKDYNDKFPSAEEVSKRFRSVMDSLDEQLARDLPSLVFKRKPLFHTLFTFYYDRVFGVKSSLRRARPRAISRAVAEAVRRASEDIAAGNVPEDLAKALRGATGDPRSREKRLQFLQSAYERIKH